MSRFRARHCPNCDYYIGFSVLTRPARGSQTPITNFCLNCNYKFPVHTIMHGVRHAPRSSWKSNLHLVHGTTPSPSAAVRDAHSPHLTMDTSIRPDDYSRHLRTIGQDLENLHLVAFNLECTGDAYVVWVRSENANDNDNPLLRVGKNRLQKLWRNTLHSRTVVREETITDWQSQPAKRLRYSLTDLDRLEREQRGRRRPQVRTADGHSLSQLLRTIGDMVGRRGERLLGISWQELSVSMVVETARGRKEIDVFRPDNLYDLWVKMYLRRDKRAFSDTPR